MPENYDSTKYDCFIDGACNHTTLLYDTHSGRCQYLHPVKLSHW